MRRSRLLAIVTAALMPAAAAVPVPPAVSTEGLSQSWPGGYEVELNTFGTTSAAGCVDTIAGPSCGSSTVSDVYTATGATVAVFSSTTGLASTEVTGNVGYNFEIVGPADIQVPIDVSAHGNLTFTGDSSATLFTLSTYIVLDGGSLFGEINACNSGDIAHLADQCAGYLIANSFDGALHGYATANQVYSVETYAECLAQGGQCTGTIQSSLPYVDPSFQLPEGYTLVVSPPVTSVPEPGAPLLLAVGGLVVAGRSRIGRLQFVHPKP